MSATPQSPTRGATGFPADGAASSALYVGDLDKSVDEGLLYHLFSRVGPVASIRVCRDSVTRRSLGYAYVNYNTALDPHAAAKAMEVLNYTPVKNKPIRIMKAMRDPHARRSGVGNVFVKGLDPEIDSRTLHDTFEVFGPITSAKVALDEMGQSLGYGYVQYDAPESAVAAVERANGMLLKGRQLHVAPYKSKNARGIGRGFTNLYVKHLPAEVKDETDLRAMFEVYGDITSVHMAKQDGSGKIKGFGFVNYDEAESAVKAIEAMNGKEQGGTKLYVGPAQKRVVRQKLLREKYEQMKRERQQSCQGRNLYVKHINPDMGEDGFRTLFEKFGTITSAKVMTDEAGKSRGFGFVCFGTTEEASKAMSEMNGQLEDGQQLYVGLAQPKEVRQAELARQRMANLGIGAGMGAGGGGGAGAGAGATAGGYPGAMVPPGAMMGGPGGLWPSMMGGPGGYKGGRGMGAARGGRFGRGRGRSGRGFGRGGRGAFAEAFVPASMKGGVPALDVMGVASGAALAPQSLSAASPRQQKVMLGERLYPLVHSLQPDRAAKVTGMLLEMDNAEILLLIENPGALASKVEEAVGVLGDHGLLDAKAKEEAKAV
ncbi:hypothetical protein BSKO_03246 [Bryopsis sp. KO-2023]|nr:hypothetical protein BSKO_03246 [Bryopsis sp. KO-2023]